MGRATRLSEPPPSDFVACREKGPSLETTHEPGGATSVDSLQRDLAVLAAERDRLSKRAAALSDQLLESEQALVELEEMRTRVTQLEASVAEAEAELESAYRQIDNLTRELEAIHSTVSWRVTGVLRAVRRLTTGARPTR